MTVPARRRRRRHGRPTNDDPHGNNTEGNGLTGTSGGAYFVDEPEYVAPTRRSCRPARPTCGSATRPTRPTSTPAGSSTTSWSTAPRPTLSSDEGEWFETDGIQDNNWTVQVVATCDLTPGVDSPYEIVDGAWQLRLPAQGDQISQGGFNTKCANGNQADFVVAVSNLPAG